MLRSTLISVFAVCLLSSAASAKKENDPILAALKKEISVASSYQADGSVKISAIVRPTFSERIAPIVLYKAALEARQSGFSHFRIVKKKFWSVYVYGNLINADAVMVIRFVKPDEPTLPSNKEPDVSAVEAISAFRELFSAFDSNLSSRSSPEGLPMPMASSSAS